MVEDLSDIFTKEGIQKLHKGQLLRFEYEGSPIEFIITRLNKKSGVVMGKPVTTHDPNDVSVENAFGETESFNDYKEGKDGA